MVRDGAARLLTMRALLEGNLILRSALLRASRRMGHTQLLVLATQCVRGLQGSSAPKRKRAQGRPGARCTRGLVCKLHIRKRTRAYRFSGGSPAFPAQWLYGLLRALPGDRLSCHRRQRDANIIAGLTPASRRQDHTTSPSASAPFVNCADHVHRIPPQRS